MIEVMFDTEPDESGYGRIIIQGNRGKRFFGLPLEIVEDYKALREQNQQASEFIELKQECA